MSSLKIERKQGIRKKHAYGMGVIKRKDIYYIAISVVIWASWLVVSRAVYLGRVLLYGHHGFSLNEWSLFLGIGGFTSILGALAAGWSMDKFGRMKSFYVSAIGLIFSLGLISFLPRAWLPIAPALALFFPDVQLLLDSGLYT